MNLVHALYEPAGDGPHPTILALHGWGASALDLLGLAPHLGAGRYRLICPQGPLTVPIGPGAAGYGWFPITMGAPPDPVAFAEAALALDRFRADAMARAGVAPKDLVVIGFSQGGVMAYAQALRAGARPAAIAALSSWLAPGLVETIGATRLDGLPVLVQHGVRDELIPIARGRDSVERLRDLGADVTFREYDMGHEISAASLRDLAAFLHRQLGSRLVVP